MLRPAVADNAVPRFLEMSASDTCAATDDDAPPGPQVTVTCALASLINGRATRRSSEPAVFRPSVYEGVNGLISPNGAGTDRLGLSTQSTPPPSAWSGALWLLGSITSFAPDCGSRSKPPTHASWAVS